jgi:hypothetical protein
MRHEVVSMVAHTCNPIFLEGKDRKISIRIQSEQKISEILS